MAENTLAALEAYDALGLSLDRAQEGADAIRLSRWRGEELQLAGGGLVINDAYNANPTSMRAALLDLTERAGSRRRVAILGEMAELGDASPRYHQEVGRLVDELGIEVAIAVGSGAAAAYLGDLTRPGRRLVPDVEALADALGVLAPGDAILVKASRSVGLEGISASIEKRARAWSAS
jgi:UDP-N-acetylmuramoyl-tripeptide--D-alanyl-D-alanine ligase